MGMVCKKMTTPEQLAGRADGVVRALVERSRSEVRGLFSQGCVKLNGHPCDDAGEHVDAGDAVEVRYDPQQRYHERARPWEDDAFSIVFEDKHLIVVEKTAGTLTTAANPGDKNTLVEALMRYFAHRGIRERVPLVHRLDRDVSGLLVFAKSRAIAEELQRQFEARKPERQYAAIVKGVIGESGDKGTFESYLATTRSHQRYSTDLAGEGELAITHFQLEKIVHGASWVRVWLETGRRNQIRVHFAEAGHPVLGDSRYRPDISKHPRWRAKRLALHAAVLGFTHPVTGKPLRFQSRLPKAMRLFLGEH